MRFLIALCVITGAALVYLMSQASANSEAFTNNITLLLRLAGGLAAGLMALIVYQLLILRKKLRERVFGSKLTLRLMMVFALMALIPGGLMYAVSYQFIQRSIESWFDVRVDDSLNVGLRLAQNALENSKKELGDKADSMAIALATSNAADVATLNRLREQHSIEEVMLLSGRGRVIAQAGAEPVSLLADVPGPNLLRQVRTQQRVRSSKTFRIAGVPARARAP
jgi:nitrogen fixation/metabolism regulation signal transduction histidine kinase